jgi:hypothetical protein
MNDMLSYKLNYLFMCHVLQSNNFSTFGKVVYGDQYKLMPF